MRIDIRSASVDLPHSDRERVRTRVRLALDRHSQRIERVRVHFADENGPRGGVDHRCTMTLNVRGLGRIVVTKLGEDSDQALQRAAESTSRALTRRLSRALGYRRQPSARRMPVVVR